MKRMLRSRKWILGGSTVILVLLDGNSGVGLNGSGYFSTEEMQILKTLKPALLLPLGSKDCWDYHARISFR
jgi:hypothetical protein